MIAVGVGCRKGCAANEIVRVIDRALDLAHKTRADAHALFAPDFKRSEPGLVLAAEQLHKPLLWLPVPELQAQAAHALSHSEQTLQRYGLPSIAETAALAGAVSFAHGRAQARLLGPRSQLAAATCALATLDLTESS